MARRTNQTGIDLIKSFEGLRLNVYKDAAGLPTIGYGHLLKPGETYTSISLDEAEAILRNDLIQTEKSVERLIRASLTDNQFAALVSLTFNIGSGNLQNSTARMKINRGEYKAGAEAMKLWNMAGGKKLPGLVRRRQAEYDLFMRDSYHQANPADQEDNQIIKEDRKSVV